MLKVLYGARPAEFKSAYGLDEAVSRLQAVTKPDTLSLMVQQTPMGSVSASNVRLRRAIPMVRNYFKPCFYGSFEQRGSDVYLIGRFTRTPLAKIFATVWLACALVFALLFIGISVTTRKFDWITVLAPIGIVGFAVGYIAFSMSLSKGDEAWLSEAIRSAIG